MKKTIAMLLLVAISLTSCWKMDKPTPPRELAPAVFKDTLVPVKFELGYREVKGHYEAGQWVPSIYAMDSMQPTQWARVPIKDFEVVPNGNQVMKYSYWSGFGWLQLAGIILIAFLILLIWKVNIGNDYQTKYKPKLRIFKFIMAPIQPDESKGAVFYTRTAMVIAIIGIAFLTLRPANIADNNAKTITEFKLKHYQAIDPQLNYFWDSVYNSGAIIKK